MKFVIVIGSPYRSNEVNRVLGPFTSEPEAIEAWNLLANTVGFHEDSLYAIVPMMSLASELLQAEKSAIDMDLVP